METMRYIIFYDLKAAIKTNHYQKLFFAACLNFASSVVFAQVGHNIQGVGAVNMSMGGTATAQPLSIEGTLHWNPATLSDFDGKILSISVGRFSLLQL